MCNSEEYCRSGNFRVFKFSRISDLGLFTKVRIRDFFLIVLL